MKFSEMSYTRPDIDALLGQCKALAAKAAGAASGYSFTNQIASSLVSLPSLIS